MKAEELVELSGTYSAKLLHHIKSGLHNGLGTINTLPKQTPGIETER
jgi:hypothetical protein